MVKCHFRHFMRWEDVMEHKPRARLFLIVIIHFILTCFLSVLITSIPAIITDFKDRSTYNNLWHLLVFLISFYVYAPIIYIPLTAIFFYYVKKRGANISQIMVVTFTLIVALLIYILLFKSRYFGAFQSDNSFYTEMGTIGTSLIWGAVYSYLFKKLFEKELAITN